MHVLMLQVGKYSARVVLKTGAAKFGTAIKPVMFGTPRDALHESMLTTRGFEVQVDRTTFQDLGRHPCELPSCTRKRWNR